MECPHCQKELPALPCAHCGQLALSGPEGEPPKWLTCTSCGRLALPDANYCPGCGGPLHAHTGDDSEAFDPGERLACPDGLCVGIIGDDNCTECGKPYHPEGGG
jgi:RNA polymerase subunit RPABC4/transcription elongation factor Spt4